jgi:electron transfer flavoprotein alpha subunit
LIWRPHGEHVGQTGKPVATNLYIAIGISERYNTSGISSSKIKVVINSDPEALSLKLLIMDCRRCL